MIGRSWHGGLSGPLMVVHFRLAPPLRRPPLTHTQLGHTQLTHHTTSSHTTYSHTTSSHTTSSHTTCHHTTCHPTTYSHTTCRHGSSLCVAGVALMALGWLWWRAWFPVDAVGAAALCVAGVALGDMDRHFAARMALMALGWLWWCDLVPSWRRGRCVGGVALMALGWLWWRAWFPVDAVGAAALCVAGVALMATSTFTLAWQACLHFAWQAWHLWQWAGSGGALVDAWQAWHLATSTFTLRGRRATWRHRPSLCTAGVALMALGWLWWRRGT